MFHIKTYFSAMEYTHFCISQFGERQIEHGTLGERYISTLSRNRLFFIFFFEVAVAYLCVWGCGGALKMQNTERFPRIQGELTAGLLLAWQSVVCGVVR